MKNFLLVLIILSTAITGMAQTHTSSRIADTSQAKRNARANTLKLVQSGVKISIGPEFGLPIGQSSKTYTAVGGASVEIEIPVVTATRLTATLGYDYFIVQRSLSGINNAAYVPTELGIKYFISKVGYIEGNAGVSNNVNSNYTNAKTVFMYSPVIGVCAPTNSHKATIDFGLRYEARVESNGTVGQIAARLAYRFGL